MLSIYKSRYHGNKTKRNQSTNYIYYCTHTNKCTKKKKFETKSGNIANLNIYIYEEFEDTKGVTRIRKSMKDRQHNGHEKKGQTTIYKTFT